MIMHTDSPLPSSTHDGSGVGWDMAVEMLNAAIKAHVAHHISEAQIRQFVANWALLEVVQQRLRAMMYSQRGERNRSSTVDATPDVNKLVGVFKQVIGNSWAQATTPNTVSHVTTGSGRARLPWLEVRSVMARRGDDAPHVYIRKHVRELTPFFSWMP